MKKRKIKLIIFLCLVLLSINSFAEEQITDNIYVRPDKYRLIINILNDVKFEQTILTFSEREREIVITEIPEWIEEYKNIINFCERYDEVFYETKKIFFEKYIVPPSSDNIIFFGNWVIYNNNISLEYNAEYKSSLKQIRYQLNYDGITLEAYVNIMNKFLNSNYRVARTIANNKITIQSRHEISLLYLEEVFLKTLKMYGYNVSGYLIDINYGLSGIDENKKIVVFFYSNNSKLEKVINELVSTELDFKFIKEGKICLAIGSIRSITEITNKWRNIESVFAKECVKSYSTNIFKPDHVKAMLNQVLAIDENTKAFSEFSDIDINRDIVSVPLMYNNSLLLGYPKDYKEYFDNIIFNLSQMEEDKFNFVNIINVVYGNAEEISAILNDIYSAQSEILQISTSNISNAIIVKTTNRVMIRELTNIIKEFDKRPTQVLIEVLIAEVKLDDNFRYGFEWQIGDQNQQGGFEGNLRKGDMAGLPFNGLKYSLLNQNFNLFLNAMQTSSEVNILSKPQIMTKNNSLAKIVIGQEVPVSKMQSLSGRTGDINRNNNTTGANFGTDPDDRQAVWVNYDLGNYPNLSVEYKDVGITLEVIPTIGKDNTIMLDLTQIVSEIESVGLLENPIIQKREASTVVVAENNNTIVIGGMIKQNTAQINKKVPYLSRIPLIGESLFTTTEKMEYSTELLIFITPTIVEDTITAKTEK
jgi:type II secretory pathway component GspD/PulD (secretin)